MGEISSRAADSDLKAKKVTPAPEPAATPPALPCARTALILTRPRPHSHARCAQPLFSPDDRGPAPPRCARRRGGGPAPSSAQRGSRRSGARGRGARRAAAGTRRGCPAGTREGAGTERRTRGRQGSRRDDAAALLPAPPSGTSACTCRWELAFGKARGTGACVRWLSQAVGGAENPSGPARPRAVRGLFWRWPAGGAGGFAPCRDPTACPGAEEGLAGDPDPSGLPLLRLSERSSGVLRLVLSQIGPVVTLVTNRGREVSLSGLGGCRRPRTAGEFASWLLA